MTDLIVRLQTALAGRYAIERELGHGGMALVFLAQDLKHHRPVAIKVLRPELAVVLGAERFLREIEIAAGLTHPHILPLHDSGEAEGFLYYVMPYVEGESLRERLAREKQLLVDEALRIAREVADALAYAHSHDVVHRDVKPENILLEAGYAVVSDFGIARAITVASGERLTETGIALGTPAYMSPEQAAGGRELDGRSDIYSLGCVLYEMLAGQPPFTGPAAESVLHQHLAAEPPLVTGVRGTVPAAVGQAIRRALAKTPADRFATARQFAENLAAARSAPGVAERATGRRWAAAVGAGVVVLALAAAVVARWWPSDASRPNPDRVAVLPFRVSAADPSLHYLRDGMVDLLAAKLTGEGGPRAVDPRAVLSALPRGSAGEEVGLSERDALGLAARLDAGWLITGSVVGSERRVILNASLLEVPSGRLRASATVEGPPDSLLDRIDGLTGQLLLQQAGEAAHRLAAVTTESPAALHAYLEGRAAYARRDYEEAGRHFGRALALDSTFALAAMWMEMASEWLQDLDLRSRGLAAAWGHRNRLSARDRTILRAQAGPRYPQASSVSETIAAWEQAVAAAPDQPEVWYRLGDMLLHWGPAYGATAAVQRGGDAFWRAAELDSTFGDALHHLVELAAAARDTAAVRQWARVYLAADSSGPDADFVRWLSARTTDDRAALRTLRDRFRQEDFPPFLVILGEMLRSGAGLEDVDVVAEGVRRTPRSRAERLFAADFLRQVALDRGRPGQALAIARDWQRAEPESRLPLRWLVADRLFDFGDDSTAVAAVAQLAKSADTPPARDPAEREERLRDICLVSLWRLAREDRRTISRAIEQLQTVTLSRDLSGLPTGSLCAGLLEAQALVQDRSAAAGAAMDRLDSLLLNEPFTLDLFLDPTYLILAELREALGDRPGALAALRRRPWGQQCCQRYLSTFLRQEGRLAALTGDREGAIRAYSHYLALRSDPEAVVRPEVERVRAELGRLERRGPWEERLNRP